MENAGGTEKKRPLQISSKRKSNRVTEGSKGGVGNEKLQDLIKKKWQNKRERRGGWDRARGKPRGKEEK